MHDYVDENHQFHIVQTAEASSSRLWQVPDDHNDEKLEVLFHIPYEWTLQTISFMIVIGRFQLAIAVELARLQLANQARESRERWSGS